MRQYQPIWEKLKELLDKPADERAKGVSVVCNRIYHPRVLKAVVKEKYNDTWFKLKIEPRKALLSHTRKNSTITFFLELTKNSITAQDL